MRFTVSVVITALFAASAIAAATSNVTNSASILEVNSSNIASVKCVCPCCIKTGGDLHCC
ncbi:hypothetical protein CPC08DRAFT_713804 [Agrocybe pediades]|nr:hypothetical protein CPC08DRAFT_716045 [Agrocybe pediades]KAF9553389.1 hypothetical protein CPC08DRAFT_713804 [Agrocybe pediades]